jgi:tight junction protein 1
MCRVNDRIISANGVSLEGADYGAAVRVLRDSGSTVLLVVKRRALTSTAPPSPGQMTGPQSHRLSLTRPSKKDDFGIVLGCRLYVREVTREGTGARPGDLVTRIAGLQTDNMSLKEARKLMEQSKDRLSIVVSREPGPGAADPPKAAESAQPGYSSQNLYVPPPTRQALAQAAALEDKSNLAPRGRSRGPLMDVSLSQLDLPATPTQAHKEPPRPPPPRPEGKKLVPDSWAQAPDSIKPTFLPVADYYSSRRQMYEDDPLVQRTKQPV